MKFLANLWRKLRGKPSPVQELVAAIAADEPDVSTGWGRVLAALGGSRPTLPRFDPLGERVEWKMPEIMPGVRPAVAPTGTSLRLAMDSGYQEFPMMTYDSVPQGAAWGFGTSGQLGPGLAFLGFPYLAELEQITEYRTPAESLSTEMTRRWLKHTNKGKNDLKEKIKQIEDRSEELGVRPCFREAALKTEFFGRSHIAINVRGQDDDITRQLPLTKINKGDLLGFKTIEPYWLTPYSWNSTHPSRPDFYKPQSWFELGKKTHHSRYLTFIFREVPDLLKPAYDFAGISMTQLMMPYVNRWLRTAKNVNDLINIFSIVTLATDLQNLLAKPVEFLKRLQVFTEQRDNRGIMAISKDKEALTTQNIPLGSLDKLQAQAQEHMSTPSRMPLIEFFGITPSGLNASSEGEMQVRNKNVKGMQELGFTPHYKRVLDLIQLDLFGVIDPDIGFDWQPLYEPSGKELAEIRKADSDRDGGLIEKNVISPDEVRDKLRDDPESGYNGLEGPAPEPQIYSEGLPGEPPLPGENKPPGGQKPPAN